MSDLSKPTHPKNKSIQLVSLALGTIIFAASFAVLAKIIQLGESHLIEGRNPISYCNVLLVGNLIAGLTYIALFWRDLNPKKLTRISGKNWLLVVLVGLLEGAIAPTLIFLALTEISVASVVLLQSIKIPLVLLVGYFLFHEIADRLTIFGAVLSMLGAALMVGFSLGADATIGANPSGMLKVIVAAILFVVSVQLRRQFVDTVSIGIFSMARMIVGSLFFLLALYTMMGPSHFTDILNPFLWKWMIIYAFAIVVVGQLTWQWGLKAANSKHLSLAEASLPLLGLLFGFIVLAEIPMKFEWIGGSILLFGIALTLIGMKHTERRSQQADTHHNFTGV